jgi:hypothetical protein
VKNIDESLEAIIDGFTTILDWGKECSGRDCNII